MSNFWMNYFEWSIITLIVFCGISTFEENFYKIFRLPCMYYITNMNWFGCILHCIFLWLVCPIPAIFLFVYWLFHVGRKD